MKKTLLILLVLIPLFGIAQKDSIVVGDDFEEIAPPPMKAPPSSQGDVFELVENMPEYKGGRDSLAAFISKKITYPKEALEAGKEGIVYLKFVVEPDGKVRNIRVVKSFDNNCSNEAIRLIKLTSGKWKPGKQRGKNVRVNVVQPIKFKLKKPMPMPEPTHEAEPFESIEYDPMYPGGEKALKKFLNKNLVYPPSAVKNKKEGKVYVKFVVNTDGSVDKVHSVKSFDDDCADEAVRITKLMKWIPGESRNKKVPVWVVIPIVFKLK